MREVDTSIRRSATRRGAATDGGLKGSLLVIGAAAGMGSWLCDHLFPQLPWSVVSLVDTEESLKLLDSRDWAFRCPVVQGFLTQSTDVASIRAVPRGLFGELGRAQAKAEIRALARSAPGSESIDLGAPGLTICLAVPRDAVEAICAAVLPAAAPDATIVVVTQVMRETLIEVGRHSRGRAVLGVHPLFESNALSLDGQTVYVVPAEPVTAGSVSSDWFVDAVVEAGGIVKVGTAARHDEVMSYVQGAAHQSLLTFADVVLTSGLDLQEDVWAARTPLFESLFGLAARVLEKRRQATISDTQLMFDGALISTRLDRASERLRAAIETGDRDVVAQHITAIRDHFGGTLFETVRAAATAAVNAAQAKRAELARCRRTGELVGIRLLGREDLLRVGRIVAVGANEVTLQELLVRKPEQAALLVDAGIANARRQGFNQKVRETAFALGHIQLVLAAQLERELETSLARVRKDIRFLVPESVAGSGVLAVVAAVPGIRDCELVSEAVRTGQRSVVIGVGIRIDRNFEQMIELLRQRVHAAYGWPKGIARPSLVGSQPVSYLGPPGTFSEVAALHCAQTMGITDAVLEAQDGFENVLAQVSNGALAVLPITSSSSGLVGRAAATLLAHPSDLAAGGVVDVAVRLDAYVRQDGDIVHGATLYSHPQALAQCTSFISRWGLLPVPCESTTEALQRVSDTDGAAVALAGEGKESIFRRLRVAEREVDDLSGSITRFLIVGRPGSFGPFTGGSDPTLRSILVCASIDQVAAAVRGGTSSFDEILTDDTGRCLWVTSRIVDDHHQVEGKHLGRAPWSPRTPVVRIEAR